MRKIRFLSMLAAVTAVALAMVVAASPAARAETWGLSDDTALAGGHDVVGNPTEYLSTLPGQLEAIRIVYRIASGHVEEMAVNGISWSVRDLTALTHAPAAAGDPAASQTRLSGQDPVGQVVYRTAGGHIELLTIRGNPLPAATGVDLTALTGAPVAAGDPAMYQTNLAGQGLVLRIVYRAAGWGGAHIVELSVRAGHPWKQADLTALTGAPAAAGNPAGYETHLDGQGSTGRVVYRTASGHVEELSVRAGHPWTRADLTALTGAPAAAGNPAGYLTHLTGQGLAARVIYRTASGHVEELSVRVGHPWTRADLTAITGAPAAAGNPAGYQTILGGESPVARVVYRTASGHIEQLTVQGGQAWKRLDMTALISAPAAAGNPDGHQTVFWANDIPPNADIYPLASVLYRNPANGHVLEMFSPA